jgi:hypothetical protein
MSSWTYGCSSNPTSSKGLNKVMFHDIKISHCPQLMQKSTLDYQFCKPFPPVSTRLTFYSKRHNLFFISYHLMQEAYTTCFIVKTHPCNSVILRWYVFFFYTIWWSVRQNNLIHFIKAYLLRQWIGKYIKIIKFKMIMSSRHGEKIMHIRIWWESKKQKDH